MSPKVAKKVNIQEQIYTPADIIKANFPVYESLKNIKISKLNKIFTISLAASLLLSVGIYAIVVSKQNQIESLHLQTKKLNVENVELQSRLESLRSFDNIDAKLSSSNFLKRPEKVIEVNTNIPNLKVKFENKGPKIESMLGY